MGRGEKKKKKGQKKKREKDENEVSTFVYPYREDHHTTPHPYNPHHTTPHCTHRTLDSRLRDRGRLRVYITPRSTQIIYSYITKI